MKTYNLRSVARRGSMFTAAVVIAGASLLPVTSSYADALNPLTERSLTLSSGSPGWSYLDASGNAHYAPPNSGANGQKTGNTFSFRVSSTADIKGLTFQYCTTPAGNCLGPGNNGYDTSGGAGSSVRFDNDATRIGQKKSDLEVVVDDDTVGEISSTTYTNKFDALLGQPAATGSPSTYDPDTIHPNMPKLDGSEGNFIVLHRSDTSSAWTQSTGWEMAASVNQTYNDAPASEGDEHSTGKNNFITLTNASSAAELSAGDYVKVIFFATDTTYITNPGSKEFFVKINTYNSDTAQNSTTLVDGGVTVANVMNRSIEIQTKVLETMDFSVGTVDPNTLDSDDGTGDSEFTTATGNNQHGPCDPIVQGMDANPALPKNVLKLGDENGEFSLRTDTTYSTHSYWRLSSNSSGGATVYYSGVTLSNTVGDQIKAIGTDAQPPVEGSEQFGLALDNETTGTRNVDYTVERDSGKVFENAEDNTTNGIHATTTAAVGSNPSYHAPRLAPLTADADYALGRGVINSEYGTLNTQFAFDPESSTIPRAFASGTQVLDCATGKMRYIANIAATTPAGIYTTKINYIAAPKY